MRTRSPRFERGDRARSNKRSRRFGRCCLPIRWRSPDTTCGSPRSWLRPQVRLRSAHSMSLSAISSTRRARQFTLQIESWSWSRRASPRRSWLEPSRSEPPALFGECLAYSEASAWKSFASPQATEFGPSASGAWDVSSRCCGFPYFLRYKACRRIPSPGMKPLASPSEPSWRLESWLKEVSDIGDLEAFKSVNERWSDVLRGWDPESRAPSETAIQIQEHHLGPGHPDVIRLREERDVARDQAELLSELSLQRSHYRFLVAVWKLRRLRLREGDGTAEAAVFRELAGHFRDARSLEAAVARVYDEEFVGGGGALYGWIATEAGDSAIGYGPHSIAGGAEPELLRCFLVLFVLLANPASGVSPFEAGDWLGPRLAQLNDELGRLYADSDLWAAVGIDQLDERVEAVRDALHESVALHRRSTERALAESTPRVDLIERFEEALVQIRRANRVAAGVFELGGSAVEDGACPPGVRHVVCATTLSKNDFTTEQSDANDSVVAAGIGSRLGLNDVSLLNSLFSALTDYDPRGASTADAIRKGLAHLGANGYTPSILVLSSDWRRLMALDLPPIGTYDGVVELPAGLVRLMRGTFEGIPVLVLPNASHDVAVAVDLARFGEWHECHIDGPQSMKASVLFVDAEEAAQRAKSGPECGAGCVALGGRGTCVEPPLRCRGHPGGGLSLRPEGLRSRPAHCASVRNRRLTQVPSNVHPVAG